MIERGDGITLDPRLPFPDSVGGIFLGPATTQKVYQGIDGFPRVSQPARRGYNDWQFWASFLYIMYAWIPTRARNNLRDEINNPKLSQNYKGI